MRRAFSARTHAQQAVHGSCRSSRASQVLCVGNRGMGAFKRSLMSFIGLGSVSHYLAHHAECMLAVVKVGL